MEVSKYIINFFKDKGIDNFFVFQGANISHLINEIGKKFSPPPGLPPTSSK